jgi:hypothetical protein
MMRVRLFLLALVTVGCGGATARPPADPRAVAADAQARFCDGGQPASVVAALAAEAVTQVEPIHEEERGRYAIHQGALVGARVSVRALPGRTPESLERALRCHCAGRVLAGQRVADRDAAFCVLDGRGGIEVGFERRGYVVSLRGRTPRQAAALLMQVRGLVPQQTAQLAPDAPAYRPMARDAAGIR